MVSPPPMAGASLSGAMSTALRKCTRSTVCAVLATSTKSIPLTTGDAKTLARRSRMSMSAHHELCLLLRLRLQQHVIDLHQDLRIIAARTRRDRDAPHGDLVAEPLLQAVLDQHLRGRLQRIAVRRE